MFLVLEVLCFPLPVVSEGKALTYFSFDEDHTADTKDTYSHKQSVYGEAVQGAVEVLLTSKEVDAEVQRCCIEITKVRE